MEIEILPFKIQGGTVKMKFSLLKIQGTQSKWNSPCLKSRGHHEKKNNKFVQNMLDNILV